MSKQGDVRKFCLLGLDDSEQQQKEQAQWEKRGLAVSILTDCNTNFFPFNWRVKVGNMRTDHSNCTYGE